VGRPKILKPFKSGGDTVSLKGATLAAFVFACIATADRAYGFFVVTVQSFGSFSEVPMRATISSTISILAQATLAAFLFALHSRQRSREGA
jgi:hypothetical protein